ncbi:MAG: hypothetical protein ACUVXA_10665 [Candidatus Jordarchaeum sp.]|uniref:hypothetical protein n=1 Tax=Candidatus Jordarchaeum sp. TaxID=2823881 RepID=UPI00404A3645
MKEQDETWVICPICKTKLKKENISAHLRHVHDKKIEDVDESLIKVIPKKGQQKPRVSKAVIAGVFVVLVVVVVALFFLFSGFSDNSDTNGSHSSGSSWLESYTPVHSLGTGNDGFWIDHPIDGSITHPQWVIDSLQKGCVVFVVHRMYCTWCAPQADRVIALAEKYEHDNLVFYDLDIDQGGATEMKGYDSLIYDPDGAPHYIALTGIITLIEKDGSKQVAWHAWEGDMEESEIEDWMKDAMYYHHINSGG